MPDGGDPFAAAGLVPVGPQVSQAAPVASPPAAGPNDAANPFAAAGLVPVADAPTAPAPSPSALLPPVTGHLANAAAGVLEGAGGALNVAADPFGNLIGKPAVTAGLYVHDLLAPHFGWKQSTPEDRALLLGDDVPQPGTAAVNAASQAGAGKTPADVKSGGIGDDIVRAGVGGAVQMAIMGPAAGLDLLPAAASGAAGSLTGEAAAAVAPDYAKPMASLIGNIAGSGAALGAPGLARDVGGAIADRTVGPAVGTPQAVLGADGQPIPLSTVTGDATHTQPIMATPTQAAMAGQNLMAAASDPSKAGAALDTPAAPLVAGSQPTTFQATGDQGLGNFERVAATKNPEIMIGRQNQQNAARISAVQAVEPAGADPGAVPAALKARLDNMTAQYAQAAAEAQGRIAAGVNAVGGSVPAGGEATALQTFGAKMRGEAPVAEADGQPSTPGTSLVGANAAAKANESALWKAIDPDGTLAVDMTPIKEQAQAIAGAMPKNAAPLAGEEAAIFKTAQAVPDAQPFGELAALRSRLTDAISQGRQDGNGQAVARMSQLLDSVHDAMAGGVASKVAQDQAAVSSGQMAPDSSIMARLGPKLRPADEAAIPGPKRGPGGGVAYPAGEAPGPFGDISAGGKSLPSGGGRGGSASDSLVAARSTANLEPSPTPNFDADAAARYQAARAATRDRHATFTNAPGVGPSLAPGKFAGEFKAPDSAVPGNVFTKGAGAAERVQAYVKAGGDVPALQDYASFTLRKAAQDADGTLDPAKYATWQKNHAEALTALDAASPGIAAKYGKLAAASGAVREATARAAANVKAFETSVAKQFLSGTDPAVAIGKVLEGPRSILDMRDIKAKLENDPAALAGVRQAIVDHVLKTKIGNAAAGDTGTSVMKSDAFQTFMKKAEPAMRQVMSDEQVKTLRAVADDLQRSNRSIQGTKLHGGSNTPQDLAAGAKHASGHGNQFSTLGLMVAEATAGAFSHHAEMIMPAMAVTYAASRLKAMRDAGIDRVQNLAELAAFSPPLAKALLERAASTKAAAETQNRIFKVQLSRAMTLAAARQYSGIYAESQRNSNNP